MNLKRMIFWKSAAAPTEEFEINQTIEPGLDAEIAANVADNVIEMPSLPPLAAEEPLPPPVPENVATPPARAPQGLFDAPVLKAFFEVGHFGHGRYTGANTRTLEALELGKATIIAEFQNVLTTLVEQKWIKADKLDDALLETEGVCERTTARLGLARDRQEREIAKLREQIGLAGEGKGWVLQALNSYQQGFRVGLKSAIEFDLLAQ
jgi:hypothetical protein